MIFSPEDLITAFGDEAYQKCVKLTVECVQAGDLESSQILAKSAVALMQLGYHNMGRHK